MHINPPLQVHRKVRSDTTAFSERDMSTLKTQFHSLMIHSDKYARSDCMCVIINSIISYVFNPLSFIHSFFLYCIISLFLF